MIKRTPWKRSLLLNKERLPEPVRKVRLSSSPLLLSKPLEEKKTSEISPHALHQNKFQMDLEVEYKKETK